MKDKPIPPFLDQVLPDGQVVNRKWLQEHGYNRTTIDYYIRSGKLESVRRGVYRRPGPPLKWQHLFYSLQELGYMLHIGGRSALDLQGYVHYLSFGTDKKEITLCGKSRLPLWINDVGENIHFKALKQKGFQKLPKDSVTTMTFGHWDWRLNISSKELALFELLSRVKEKADFFIADKYFESVTVLRPALINELLQACIHIQTKQLFIWFADRHSRQWSSKIDQEKIDLGRGKRSIIKGGILDKRYNITVPREMMRDEQLFF